MVPGSILLKKWCLARFFARSFTGQRSEPTAGASDALAVERTANGQNASLIGRHDRLAEFALPRIDRGHRSEVAAGHRERLDLGTVDAGEVFFSSRRRHTSCLSDWSSDVCSSD